MFKKLVRDLQKHKYVRIEHYSKSKQLTVRYVKDKDLPKDILINPDHIYIFNGYRSIVTTDNSAQTLDPLKTKSLYAKEEFESAINSKVISELTGTIKSNKIDMVQILLIGILAVVVFTLYLLYQHTGGIKF